MRYLKQNTDSYVVVGPFIDDTDGKSLEDGLTVTNIKGILTNETQSSAPTDSDEFTCSATAANDWGCVASGHGGLYELKIPDSNINFVGSAIISLYVTGALPVFHEFMVVPANVWDSMMGTDLLDVSTVQWTGTAVHSPGTAGVPIVEIHDPSGVTIGTVTTVTNQLAASAIADAIWDEVISTGHSTANSAGKIVYDNLNAPVATIDTVVDTLTTNLADLHTDVGTAITNIGTVDTVVDGLATELAKVPKSDSTVTWNATALASINAQCDTAISDAGLTAAGIADAVWDEVLYTAHEVANSASVLMQSAGTAADPWLTALPGSYGAGTAGKIIGDNINAPIATIDTVVDGIETHVHQIDSRILGTLDTGTHKPQTGDSYAVVNSGTFGNSALKTLIDTIDTVVDGIETHVHTTDGHITADYGSTEKAAIDLLDDADGGIADVHTVVNAIKTKTDSLTFTKAGEVDSNVQSVNDTALTGNGSSTPWGPA